MVFVLEKLEIVFVKITSITKNARSYLMSCMYFLLLIAFLMSCMYFQIIHCRLRDFHWDLYFHIVERSALGNRSVRHISVDSILHRNAQSNYSILHRNAAHFLQIPLR